MKQKVADKKLQEVAIKSAIERSSFSNFDPYSSFSDIQLEVSRRVFFITSAPSSEIVFHHLGTKF
jgi:hypothetical protein